MESPKKTALYDAHIKLGAKVVEFAGWIMPVQYTGIIEEHNKTRNSCGIFDIGHMGQIETDDFDALQALTSNDIGKLKNNHAQYSFALSEKGGILDDLLVYKIEDHFLVIANASNAEKILQHFGKRSKNFRLLYDTKTAIAVQGPAAVSIIQKLTGADLSKFKHRDCGRIKVAGYEVFASRSGYTGEDGFELFFDRQRAESLWDALIKNGAFPCGLGARDSLRLEAGLPLYGHELDEATTPLEAGLSFAVDLNKIDLPPVTKRLAGFEVLDKAIARQGGKLFKDGIEIGHVTSGTYSPTLRKPIFMGYVDARFKIQDTGISVQIRENLYPVQTVKLPFYKRCDKIN